MSAKFDMLVKSLTETMKKPEKKTSPYDTTATVVRIDGDTAYVHIAGGVDETPVSRTINCNEGDTVQVRVGGGRAWITGNATAPPTDDTRAIKASGEATKFITDMSNGVFVHREGDEKNGVKITDQVDIVRDGNVSASYGEETVFYEPRTTKIAAKIGAFGLKILKGIISLGNKTSANDVTNAGTYIDSEGNMATSNIKAHGGMIGGWNINAQNLSRVTSNTTIELNNKGLDTFTATQTASYRSFYGADKAQIQSPRGNTEISSNSYYMQGENGTAWLYPNGMTLEGSEGEPYVIARSGLNNKTAFFRAISGSGTITLLTQPYSGGYAGILHDDLYWLLSSHITNHITTVHGGEVDLESTTAGVRVRLLANQNGVPVFVPSVNGSIFLGTNNLRWKSVYCTDGAFNGSDLKGKSVIDDFDWKVDEFISGLKPIAFKRINEDGSVSERIRLGFGAQDVAKLSKDLDIGDLRLYDAVIVEEDENGEKIEKPYHGEDIDDSKLSWSLSYTELIAPIVLEMQRLMDRVDKLENENSQLLHRLEKLEQEVNSMKEGAVK